MEATEQMKRIKMLARHLISNIMFVFPVNKNKVVFNDFYGKFYAGNPRAISEELQSRKINDLELVWLLRDKDARVPDGVKVVRYNSLRAFYELATAKVIVQSSRGLRCRKKKGQIYLQTWHAPSAYKKVERQVEDQLTKEYVIDAKYDGEVTDGIIADSETQATLFRDYFWLGTDAEILCFGLPRNDALIRKADDNYIKMLCRQQLKCRDNDYLVLYAPTFRKSSSSASYIADFESLSKSFTRLTKKRVKFLVRLHPKVSSETFFFKESENVINVSAYPDVQELAIACDAVISDYSSIFNDFLLLGKPIFLYINDIDLYINEDRGLADIYFELPVPRAKNIDDLCRLVRTFDSERYKQRVDVFLTKHPNYEDGHASQRTVDWILRKMKGASNEEDY